MIFRPPSTLGRFDLWISVDGSKDLIQTNSTKYKIFKKNELSSRFPKSWFSLIFATNINRFVTSLKMEIRPFGFVDLS